MKSIQRRFRRISQRNPNLGSLVCFRRTIEGQEFKKRTIRHWFKLLVEKDDYDKKEKRAILQDLEEIKPP